MPPPPSSKAKSRMLIEKFRLVCGSFGWKGIRKIQKVQALLNSNLHEKDHVSLSTASKLLYDKPGICLNSETVLAIAEIVQQSKLK